MVTLAGCGLRSDRNDVHNSALKVQVETCSDCSQSGTKGSRRQAVVRELRGETIDIIEWSDDLAVFAARALTPATVKEVRVTIGGSETFIEAIVNDDQLALALGKRNQNVNLASRLVGGRIEIVADNNT